MITIEDKPLVPYAKATRCDQEFWETVKVLEVGQSFLHPKVDSNLRNGLRIAEMLLGVELATRKDKESGQIRIGRLA